MGRRTVAACVTVAMAGALAGCSLGDRAAPPTTPGSAASATSSTSGPVATAASGPVATAAGGTAGPAPSSGPARPTAARKRQGVTSTAGRAPTTAFAVGTRRIALGRGADRPLPTTVWYPAAGPAGSPPSEGRTAAPGPFPLVLFSHGLTARPSDYEAILTRWARAGFVVAAPAYPHTSHGVAAFDPVDVINQPADATHVITELLTRNGREDDPLADRIDPDRVAAAGHSAGGITTVGMLTVARDIRLDAAVVLAGRQLLTAPFTGPPTAVLFVHGKRDRTVRYADARAAFRAVPWSRAMLTVTEGGHLTTARDFRVTVDTTVDFLRWSLYGDAPARSRLSRDATRGGIATFTDNL